MYAAMKEMYGEQTLARSTIFHWHQQFTQGRAGLYITKAEEWETSGGLYCDNGEYDQYDVCG